MTPPLPPPPPPAVVMVMANGDGGGRTLWRAVVYVRVYARTRIRAREYRDSSLKIQMEYRAFEEREVPRGVRGGGL